VTGSWYQRNRERALAYARAYRERPGERERRRVRDRARYWAAPEVARRRAREWKRRNRWRYLREPGVEMPNRMGVEV
jgi:hypothetical protein